MQYWRQSTSALQLNRSDTDKATCVTEGRESCTERARQYADEDKGSGCPPDHPTRSAADADAPVRMLGLPGGIGHAVAGQAGWNGAGGEADRRAPRIARLPLGGMEAGDLGAGQDGSAALDRIRQHSRAP
jgi:hypothetical protein